MSVVALDDSPPAGDCEFRGKQTLQAPLTDADAADRQSHGAADHCRNRRAGRTALYVFPLGQRGAAQVAESHVQPGLWDDLV